MEDMKYMKEMEEVEQVFAFIPPSPIPTFLLLRPFIPPYPIPFFCLLCSFIFPLFLDECQANDLVGAVLGVEDFDLAQAADGQGESIDEFLLVVQLHAAQVMGL